MVSLSFGANFAVCIAICRSGRVNTRFFWVDADARLVGCLMPALAIKDQGCMPLMAKCGLQKIWMWHF
jgi:hypothetical protein